MGILIEFPKNGKPASKPVAPAPQLKAPPIPAPAAKPRKKLSVGQKIKLATILVIRGIWGSIWATAACLWPIVNWIAGIDIMFQLVRTVAYWNRPDVHAGWTLLAHFGVYFAYTYFVGVYRPAGFRDSPPAPQAVKKAS